jgi:cobalamin biosynthetic protein CobC
VLEHGGRLRRAAQEYGIALEAWLDLSTGVAPYGPRLPAIAAQSWRRLPELEDGLEAAARAYYGVSQLLPVAGSQAAIQALPRLRSRSRVGILTPAYAEHAAAWQREGHALQALDADNLQQALAQLDVLLLVNPNNPTGQRFRMEQLLAWHASLAPRGGWLIVDEAFIDCTAQQSLAPRAQVPGLVVLRSFGKFFGLAGARLGFVMACSELLGELQELLGPWTISGPTRELATHLLQDTQAQQLQRQRLLQDARRLADLLEQHGLPASGGCALFQWVVSARAAALQEFFARRGILVRGFARPSSIRFGLPGEALGWRRLEQALAAFAEEQG